MRSVQRNPQEANWVLWQMGQIPGKYGYRRWVSWSIYVKAKRKHRLCLCKQLPTKSTREDKERFTHQKDCQVHHRECTCGLQGEFSGGPIPRQRWEAIAVFKTPNKWLYWQWPAAKSENGFTAIRVQTNVAEPIHSVGRRISTASMRSIFLRHEKLWVSNSFRGNKKNKTIKDKKRHIF